LVRSFEFKLPLAWLLAAPVPADSGAGGKPLTPAATKVRMRLSLWQNRLPVDALPVEGWIELQLLPEHDLLALG
jgi:hypothetical protein